MHARMQVDELREDRKQIMSRVEQLNRRLDKNLIDGLMKHAKELRPEQARANPHPRPRPRPEQATYYAPSLAMRLASLSRRAMARG